ncbi:MAG: HTH domain-containing protein [Prevotellaceae bacterium]|jgi:predicted HTH transcriptional regulator|nr:HTH domain-containing protein [Prevotellaceae bacterium]
MNNIKYIVYKYSKAYTGNDNIQFDEKDIFIQQIPLDNIFEDTDVTKDVTKEILDLIAMNPEITTSEIAEKLNVVRRTILRKIEILKQNNKLIREGGRKAGKWVIN